MNLALEISIFAVLNIFMIYTIYDLLDIFFNKICIVEKNIKKLAYLLCYVLSIFTFFISKTYLNIIVIAICILGLTFVYKTNFKKRILASLLVIIFLLGIESSIRVFVFGSILYSSIMPIYSLSITRLLQFIVVKIYKITNIKQSKLEVVEWFKLLVVPLISLGIMYILTIISIGLSEDIIILIIVIIGLISIINIYFFNLYDFTIESNKNKIENIILSKQIQYYKNQYNQIENNLNQMKQIKHDLKHRLTSIIITKSDEEIDELLLEITNDDYISYTNIHSLDAILNFKKKKANDLAVGFVVESTIYKDILVDGQDLCVIIGNVLDNAIEASSKIENSKITIKLLQENNSFYVNISNPFIEPIYLKNGLIKSNKTSINHGIGLKSVNNIVDNIGGNLKISIKGNIFTLEILLLDCNSKLK